MRRLSFFDELCIVIMLGAVSTVTAQNTTVSSDSDSNSWHGWWQQEQTPTWDSDLGCFLDDQQCAGTRAELNDLGWYRVQDSPFDGFFDGVYRPDRFLHGSRNLPVWTLTSREAWELPVYLVKSDFYVGYWVLASDVWSSNIYAYALAPDVWVPSELSEWQPAAFNSGMNLVSVPAGEEADSDEDEEEEQDAPAPPSLFYYPNDDDATFQLQCPAGSSDVYMVECAAWCGCEEGRPCDYCCRRDGRNGWCYRDDGTSTPTAQHGFVERRGGCDVAQRGDGACDAVCNHPDFNYDDGDCCGEGGTAWQPNNCVDPRVVAPETAFRFDFNVPKCRKAVRDQGSCGSCWAFAVATVSMDQACLATLRRHESLTWQTDVFAPQHMDSCDVFGGPASGVGMCEGGYPGYAMIAFTDPTGYRPEQCYPYKYDGDAEQHFGADVRAVTCDIAWAAGVSKGECTGTDNYMARLTARGNQRPQYNTLQYKYLNPANAETIRYRLRHEGPMPFAYTVFDSFYTLRAGSLGPVGRGLYDASFNFGSTLGGHAVALIGYGQYTVAGVTTRYWAMENSWGLPSSHDRGVFYLDADADWGTLVGGYVMYHQNTLSAELPLTVVKTLVDEIHPDTSLHHRRLQAAADRRRAIVSVREGRRQLTVEERALPLLLPTPHEGDTLLSKTREAGAVESADCHSAEVLAAVKQAETLLAASLGTDVFLTAVYVCELQVTAKLHVKLEVATEVRGEPYHVSIDMSAPAALLDELLDEALPRTFELDAWQRLAATQFTHVRPRLLHPSLRAPHPSQSPPEDAAPVAAIPFAVAMVVWTVVAAWILLEI